MRRVVLAMIVSLASPCIGQGQWSMGAGAGVFTPFEGSPGVNVLLRGHTDEDDSPWRFGAELEYRNYKSDIFGVENVDFDSISLRGIVQYVFRIEPVRPYVGAGIGINLNIFDGNKVEDEISGSETLADFGTGIGVVGMGGLELPLGETFALFGEARAGVDFQLTSESDDIGAENLGGFSGMGGLRVRF